MPLLPNIPWLRRPTLGLLKLLNRDFSIRHHWVKQRLHLNLYRHRGYWYYRRKRERESIEFCYKILGPKDVIFEVGGHIGYLTQIFASLGGQVVVFEPGQNNLEYLRQNVAPFKNVQLVEKAASNTNGIASFYLDPLTGQNNSLLKDYYVFSANRANADKSATLTETQVDLIRLDDFAQERGVYPTFVKIDVEGAELKVLQGMEQIIARCHPKIMIEISDNQADVKELLRRHSYDLLRPNGEPTPERCSLENVFAIPRTSGS